MDIHLPRFPFGILTLLAALFLLIVRALPSSASGPAYLNSAQPVAHAIPYLADRAMQVVVAQPAGNTVAEAPAITIAEPAGALVVNTTDDVNNGACAAAHCSLREAIDAANHHAGADTITFNIPGGDPGCAASGVCTLRPSDSLPPLTDGQTTIDGFTQAGAKANTNQFGQPINAALKIILDGSHIGGWPEGLQVRSSGNLVRGLVIQRFNDGIAIVDASNNRIEGNFIGSDAQGSDDLGNRCHGVSISGVDGGPGSQNNVLGGSSPQARNLISGNDCVGVGIGPVGNNKVVGNYIGTNASGTAALPNNGDGVRVYNASGTNMIGGQTAGEENLIAYNGKSGIEIDGSFGAAHNTISRNRIYGNQLAGIRLSYGGNNAIAAPSIITARPTLVSGVACANCIVEIFSDQDGQGAVYEGHTTANPAGKWTFSKPAGVTGPHLTATATGSDGNTSEFSAPQLLTAHSVWLPLILRQ